MEYEWDDDKHSKNLSKHGFGFERIDLFEWDGALIFQDSRHDYFEIRYVAFGFIEKRLYVCVYTQRGMTRRIISLRKTNKREEAFYEKEIKTIN